MFFYLFYFINKVLKSLNIKCFLKVRVVFFGFWILFWERVEFLRSIVEFKCMRIYELSFEI